MAAEKADAATASWRTSDDNKDLSSNSSGPISSKLRCIPIFLYGSLYGYMSLKPLQGSFRLHGRASEEFMWGSGSLGFREPRVSVALRVQKTQ